MRQATYFCQEREAHVAACKNHAQKLHSYAFGTRAFYGASGLAGSHGLTRLYGTGKYRQHDRNGGVFSKTLSYGHTASGAHRAIERGVVPLIGYWRLEAGFYTGVSVVVNHGASDPDVAKMLRRYDQMCAARVFPNCVAFFPWPS